MLAIVAVAEARQDRRLFAQLPVSLHPREAVTDVRFPAVETGGDPPYSASKPADRESSPLATCAHGNIKRVVSAVGEGLIAVAFVHRVLQQT
jgi:hypothetical protein